MADKTTNLNLTLTNDTDATTTTFKQWRESINGETDSNMQKIDAFAGTTNAALTNKVDKDTNNTLTGTNTFNGAVFVRTPSQDYQPTTKKYVDDKVSALNIKNGTGDGSLYMNNTSELTEPADGGEQFPANTTSDKPIAAGAGAFAVGIGTQANGDVSVAEGILTRAGYDRGNGTRSIGSHAEGIHTYAKSSGSHAEGYYTEALASNSHAEGFANKIESTGWSGHAEGRENIVTGKAAHAEGHKNTASGDNSHAEGSSTLASGQSSHAEGTEASDGTKTTASGRAAHAEGSGTTSSGAASHAEGGKTIASGNQSHAEGFNTQATALYSHAEGKNTIASKAAAHAEGADTYATGEAAHAEGKENKASGKYSHAGGFGNEAKNFAGTVIGQYAKVSAASDTIYDSTSEAFVVGNGTSPTARSNAFEVHFDSTAKLGDKAVATEDFVNDKIVQTTGQSTTTVMSQKAVTDKIDALNGDLSNLATKTNIYDNSNPTIFDGYINGSTIKTSVTNKSLVIAVEPNTIYCVYRKNRNGQRFNVACITGLPTNNMTTDSDSQVNQEINFENGSYKSLCTGSTTDHIIIHYYNQNLDTVAENELREVIEVKKSGVPNEYEYRISDTVEQKLDETVQYVDTLPVYLGPNLTSTSSLYVPNGWVSEGDGIKHNSGNTTPIMFVSQTESGTKYLVEFDTTYTSGEFGTLGTVNGYSVLLYNGTTHISIPVLGDGSSLKLFPYDKEFTITNVSLRKIQDFGEEIKIQTNSVLTSNHNQNLGFWNVLLGSDNAPNAVGTTRSIAIGHGSMMSLKGGHRNIGIGTFTLNEMVGGERVVSIGADSMIKVKGAENCVAIGDASMDTARNVKDCIAIGSHALVGVGNEEQDYNGVVSIGVNSGTYNKGSFNTYVGYQAGYRNRTGQNNVEIGANCLGSNGGNSNTHIGANIKCDEGISNSIGLGDSAIPTKSNQMILGNSSVTEVVLCGNKKINFNTDGTVTWEAIS